MSPFDHVTVYGKVPPDGLTLAVPLAFPKQVTSVVETDDEGMLTALPGSEIICERI